MVREILVQGDAFRGLKVADSNGETHELMADAAYVFYGLSPNLGPIADWGLEIDKRQIPIR